MTTMLQRPLTSQHKLCSYDAFNVDEPTTHVEYVEPLHLDKPKALIVDYFGVLDGSREDKTAWMKLLKRLVSEGVDVCIAYHDVMCSLDWFTPVSDLKESGCATHISTISTGADIDYGEVSYNLLESVFLMDRNPRDVIYVSGDIQNIYEALSLGCMVKYNDDINESIEFVDVAFDITTN